MKLTISIFAAIAIFFVLGVTHAQTPPNEMDRGTSVTFSMTDIGNAMTPEERTEFQEMRRQLKVLQERGRGEREPVLREAYAEKFARLKDEFDKKFDRYAGINGQSVMVYGEPTPGASEIMAIVIAARESGGDGILYPHWARTYAGNNSQTGETIWGPLVGSNQAPGGSGNNGPSYPAGPEVRARIGYNPGQLDPIDPTVVSPGKCGAVPEDWDYAKNGEPECGCYELVFGVAENCGWSGKR